MTNRIDLNSDLGEHHNAKLDEQIMPFISSCNIACGGHAGDETTVRNTIRLAKKYHVAVGAHPSYPDRLNFGRKVMDISSDLLVNSLEEQIRMVIKVCEEEEVNLHHIKPHGALYNLAAVDETTSELICSLLKSLNPSIKMYGLAHSVMEEVASKMKVPFVGEAFADRKYEENKTLKSRSKEGAVLTDIKEVLNQVEELAVNHRAKATNWVEIHAQSICLHSDTEGAVTLAKRIHEHLVGKGISIVSV